MMSPALPDYEKELLQNAEGNVCRFNEPLNLTHTQRWMKTSLYEQIEAH